MKEKMIRYYMDVAQRTAELSYAKKLKVGSIIVKEDKIISIGYNGTPAGWSNECEEWVDDVSVWSDHDKILKTKPEVIHSEANCLAKLAKSSEAGNNSIMFITHSPCMECAKQIYTAGITEVYYKTEYRSSDGIKFLEKCGIIVTKL